MTIRTQPIRYTNGWKDYPMTVRLSDLKLGDVIELGSISIWNRLIVTDLQGLKEKYCPHVTVWRPHISLHTITGKKEQPALQYEIFELHYGNDTFKVIGNVGTELVCVEDEQ